jgi:outer membrane cobalamin receptor
VVNAKISRSLLEDRMSLYVRAENLFDEDFEQSYDLPQAGRSVYGGVDVRF